MTTDCLASLNVAVVDDDLTLCDTRSALVKPPAGTVILRENGGVLRVRTSFSHSQAVAPVEPWHRFQVQPDYLCSSRLVQSQFYTTSG
jgi:hypothetical protein